MPAPSESSTAVRRNIFNAPAPPPATAGGAGQPSRSIFDAPAPVSIATAIGSEGALPFPWPRIPTPSAAGWLAIAALASSAAVVSFIVADQGDSATTGAQRTSNGLAPR